ncbi:Sulfate adenylyltransferase subunit 1 [Labilithrix luteola]|uniref:sulfate adenylyltransferase n=1 Tax=Labilithrix luteola TaxID=1391654 RepID=A0A0K1PIW5_9BACT|nr:GTP-binding protein [Labilithrix luteola]AKU93462.1 Sulfate adenylyltransferase subunit 1 [Labilithrix luteola]
MAHGDIGGAWPLRCATAGSVDDGKSTLLGRLLFDAKALMTDQLAHVEEASRRRGFARTDLALVTDGLRAEREQGITIDVAWRYFATPRRRFVLADAPGHVEYTRNMVTAASSADLALVLVDARSGLLEQTRRHLFVTRLLGVSNVAIAINKMDLVGYDHAVFAKVRDDVANFWDGLPVPHANARLQFFPISALLGDNVVDRSTAMPWYDGQPLLAHLESVPAEAEREDAPPRFSVQWIVRPQDDARHDYRGYAGRVGSGVLRKGDRIRVLPAGTESAIQSIETYDGEIEEARAGTSCVVHLADDVSVSRGDLLAPVERAPVTTESFTADLAWLHSSPPRPREVFVLKSGAREVRATVDTVLSHYDVTTGAAVPTDAAPSLNTLVHARIRTYEPLVVDPYQDVRPTGSFLLIDSSTASTRAAGMVRSAG